MAYQETRTVGYGSRVGSSFRGIGAGIMLFLAGTALLWWNEGRAVISPRQNRCHRNPRTCKNQQK